MNTAHLPTYLIVFIIPLILFYLASSVTRLSPVDRRTLAKLLLTPSPPGLQGRSRCLPPRPRGRGPKNQPMRTWDKKRVVSVRHYVQAKEKTIKWMAYLFSLLWTSFKVGCCVEVVFHSILKWLHTLPWPRRTVRVALQASRHPALANDVRFDSNSFAVSIDNHASHCMGNDKRLFD